jgi:2'-5' RNA ligase
MPDAALLALHTAVVRCMAATGITGAASGFRPHITLAGEFRAEAIELDLSFNELCVFQSIPTPAGRRYERLDSLALGTDGTPPEGGTNG